MAGVRIPRRDYMDPGAASRPRDYMDPSSAGAQASNGASSGRNGAAAGNGVHAAPGMSATTTPSMLRAPRGDFAPSNGGGAVARAASMPATGPVAALAPPQTDRSARPARRGRTSLREVFVSFEQRDFRYLGLSTLAVGFGQWAQQLGLPLLTLELTGSATQLGLLATFRGVVGTVTAPLGGVLADRYPRRAVIVASTVTSMIQALILAILILIGRIEMWHVYAFAFSGGLIQSLTQPARQAFVYDVSTDETLQNAIVMNSFVQNLARIAGPPLVGAMVVWGIGAPFVFMAATQVVATAFTLLISKQTRQGAPVRGSATGQIVEGFRATWEDKRILGLVVVHSIPPLLILPYLPFIAVVSHDVLHKGAVGYGLMISMVGWGSVIGMFALAFAGDPKNKGRLMLIGFLGYASLLVVFSQSTSFPLSLAALGLAGVFFSVAQALNNTLIQVAARNEVRGRVMAVWQMGGGLQLVGAVPMGLLIEHYGPQIGIGSFMVAATVSFVLFTVLWSSVRKM